jgi:hypothetical protein
MFKCLIPPSARNINSPMGVCVRTSDVVELLTRTTAHSLSANRCEKEALGFFPVESAL